MPIENANNQAVQAASAALQCGELVAFPTETVYGLGADASNASAVVKIFEAKGRPRFNPLIVHVSSLEAAQNLAEFNPVANKLAQVFWPGPLTMVLPLKDDSGIADLVTAGLETIAIRVPGHRTARALLETSGLAIAAPSANRSGHVSPTTAEHVYADLGERPAMILDGGACQVGLESTIVGFDGERMVYLRAGSITREALQNATGADIVELAGERSKPVSPGRLSSHYAPSVPLRLNANSVKPGEVLLAFGPNAPECQSCAINLSATGDLAEAAANLFSSLRKLDKPGTKAIAVMPIPASGLGEAINDRLSRAAAPRP